MTTELNCPNCNWALDSENINIATDLAKCENCGTICKASSLVSRQYDESLETTLKGSTIEITKELGDTVKIFFPRKGLTLWHIPQLFFLVFGFFFMTFWIREASQGSIFFALFSLPFWFVFSAMLIGIINSVFETQTLTVTNGQLTLEKKRPIKGKIIKLNFSDIQEIKLKFMKAGPFSAYSNPRYMWRNQWSFGSGIEMPAIVSGSGTLYFFEDANDAEQNWVTKYLNNKVRQAKK
jgi:hypothetical protein